MELSKNILDGVSTAGNSTELTDVLFNHMLQDVFNVAVGESISKDAHIKFVSFTEKNAYDCLLSLVLEAAKHDADSSSLSVLLEDCRVEANRISLFLKKYQETKDSIQARLALLGESFDHIIDVKWRQDYVIKSSNCEKICEPKYIIQLKTWNPQMNQEKDVTFSCTMEQLQNLVLKLKDATKCIERNAV